jgi:hypothetical protein
MAHLDTIADREAEWSATADHLKSVIDKARAAVFALSVAGALLAAIASQMAAADPAAALVRDPRTWVAIAAAVCLAAATYFTQRLLGSERVTGWVRARAVAEGLNREAHRFATAAAPYGDPDRDKAAALLNEERTKIEKDAEDLLPKLVSPAGKGVAPRGPLTVDQYMQQRVDGQIESYYRPKAAAYAKAAKRLRTTEFWLALAAALITAAASVVGKIPLWFGVTLDIAAFTAVLTTIAGAVLAHVEASRYDFLAMTYLATARRLQDRKNGPRVPLSDFVNDCETIIAAENSSWIAKWTGR